MWKCPRPAPAAAARWPYGGPRLARRARASSCVCMVRRMYAQFIAPTCCDAQCSYTCTAHYLFFAALCTSRYSLSALLCLFARARPSPPLPRSRLRHFSRTSHLLSALCFACAICSIWLLYKSKTAALSAFFSQIANNITLSTKSKEKGERGKRRGSQRSHAKHTI